MAHEKYYNSDNQEIPSVTQILKLINKKGVVDWANFLGFKRKKYKDVLNEKALLGTLVHSKIEANLLGTEYTPFIDIQIENEVDKRFKLFSLWKEFKSISCQKSEFKVNNNRYGGTIDFIGIVDGELSIVDFKTSKKPRFTHAMQLGGYMNLLEFAYPDIYNNITKAIVLCLPDKSDQFKELIIPRESIPVYQKAYEQLYESFISLNRLSKEFWNEEII